MNRSCACRNCCRNCTSSAPATRFLLALLRLMPLLTKANTVTTAVRKRLPLSRLVRCSQKERIVRPALILCCCRRFQWRFCCNCCQRYKQDTPCRSMESHCCCWWWCCCCCSRISSRCSNSDNCCSSCRSFLSCCVCLRCCATFCRCALCRDAAAMRATRAASVHSFGLHCGSFIAAVGVAVGIIAGESIIPLSSISSCTLFKNRSLSSALSWSNFSSPKMRFSALEVPLLSVLFCVLGTNNNEFLFLGEVLLTLLGTFGGLAGWGWQVME